MKDDDTTRSHRPIGLAGGKQDLRSFNLIIEYIKAFPVDLISRAMGFETIPGFLAAGELFDGDRLGVEAGIDFDCQLHRMLPWLSGSC
ncbi:hypothetical protein C5167_025363 [Papaver somniferum]|uniref:Uncharacterized protein n=1 Tax=Papaver somniferum TaxID=3469 RepID=A0A4Y7JV44_PAPSO|nr:hypothetical protein C5167_025363 [Papaver somniferum]